MNRTTRSILTGTLATLILTAGATQGMASPHQAPTAPPATSAAAEALTVDTTSSVNPEAAAEVARTKGISIEEATRQLENEQRLAAQSVGLEKALDGRTGGTYITSDGVLVVTTLDPAPKVQGRSVGVRYETVDDSTARLERIIERLDRASRKGAGALHGWYIDVPTNSVVVTVSKGANDKRTAAMLRLARSFGASVTIEYRSADLAPASAATFLVGGDGYTTPDNASCSLGFNAIDASGRNVAVTAGHCLTARGQVSKDGYLIGGRRSVNFPGDDFGTFWNNYPTYWKPSISVARYDSTYANVQGLWNRPPVGATVCKSGITTGWTCGTITSTSRTVNYSGQVVSGLVQHTACVEPGDSGGANVSAGYYALGLTSGANLVSNRYCMARYGQQNESFYQPLGEALTVNNLRLLIAG